MRALVTGASGFVGAHLLAHLRASGDEVTGVDRDDCDVVDAVRVREVLADVRPDAVYHLAAAAHVADSFDAPARVLRVNAEGTLNVLTAAAACSDRPRVLVVGSAEEYGAVRPQDVPIREDAPLRPSSPYGASKVAASVLGLQAWLGGGLEVLRTRSFNHTGPGQEPRYVVTALAHRVAHAERDRGDRVSVGALEPVRDITDVRDVVRAYRLVVEHGEPGEVYNVCRGEGWSVREVAERMLARSTRALRLEVDPALVRPVDIPVLVGDNAKIVAATGWQPEVDLDTTIADLLADARARA
jgi:GDP-4-dehydro-6-deoxy-D-mannose reductase